MNEVFLIVMGAFSAGVLFSRYDPKWYESAALGMFVAVMIMA